MTSLSDLYSLSITDSNEEFVIVLSTFSVELELALVIEWADNESFLSNAVGEIGGGRLSGSKGSSDTAIDKNNGS